MPAIQSLLWKSSLLTLNSTYFPRLVQAAAWYKGKVYTEHMLHKVATSTAVLTALTIDNSETVDVALTRFASDPATAGTLDGLILDAVQAYTPPAAPPQT